MIESVEHGCQSDFVYISITSKKNYRQRIRKRVRRGTLLGRFSLLKKEIELIYKRKESTQESIICEKLNVATF